jgi:uncharacterized protein YfaS (alpha-2-macroglobulin family)
MRHLLIVLPLLFAWIAAPLARTAGPVRLQVESFTPQGTVKGVRQVMARFNVPMVALGDPRLPPPFDLACKEPAKGRWADPRTWVLDFDRDLPAGIGCRFSLKPELRSLEGLQPVGPQTFSFDTGGAVVRASLPEDGSVRVDESQVFLLAPDAPVERDSLLAHAYCEVTGLAERIGVDLVEGPERETLLRQRRDTGYDYASLLSPDDAEAGMQLRDDALRQAEAGLLALRCRRTLPPDTDVRLVWGKGIRTLTGLAGQQDRVLTFRTRPAFSARLRCQRVNPQSGCLPMLPLELLFTAEVKAEQLRAVRLIDETGKPYPAEPIDHETQALGHRIKFNGPFPERARLRIELPDDLRDDAGRALDNAARFPLSVAVDDYPPLAKFSGDFGILEFKEGGVLPVTLRNLEPQVEGQQMVVEAKEGVPGQMRRITADDAEIIQWLERVRKAGQIRGEWVKPAGSRDGPDVWREDTGSTSVFGKADQTTPITVPKPLGEKAFEVIGIPLRQPGFYVVELSSPKLGASLLGDNRTRYVATSALVTNLGVHFKWGREGSLVWVTTLDKADPVAGAQVRISDACNGKQLWQGDTGPDGTVRPPANVIGRPHGGQECIQGSPAPVFVSARLAEDLGFTLSSWNKGIQPGDFNLNVDDYTGPEIAHTIFDRPLYRAGETVSMKHILRRHTLEGFALPADFQAAFVELTHSGSDQTVRLPVTLDQRGMAESTWPIPRDARLGAYQVALIDAKQTRRLESGLFHVEQFRLPTMRAVIQPPAEALVKPEQVTLDLALSYLSGGGAAQAPVKLRTLVEPRFVQFKGYEDYNFSAEDFREGITSATEPDDAWSQPPRKPAEILPLVLDGQGVARTTLKHLPGSDQPQDLIVEMEYQDANGELEAVTRRITLWPSALNLGIRTDGWVASRDQVRFRVVALDLAGKPVANQPVDVRLFERKTFSWRKRLIGGFYAYDNRSQVTRLEPACSGKTDDQGFLHCDVKPGVTGEILLQARTQDAKGHAVSATASTWLAGEEDTWFEGGGSDRIDLIPEQPEYQPGESARFQVRMPFREATALVTVEREGVAEHFVRPVSGKSPVIEVPVRGEHAPNMFVSALVVRGRAAPQGGWWTRLADRLQLPWQAETAPPPTALADLGKPAYRLGNAEIRVGWQAHRLDVRVEPQASVYRPRDKALVHIQVRPADGRPLPPDTELALAAVDEALLELKPNRSWRLLDAMMAVRPIEVYTATAQMQVVGKRHFGQKAVPHGGGGGRQSARELFDTLLLWKGRVPLDGRDAIDVDIPLNDSLTSFRVVAVASGGFGDFGTGSGTFQTSQPLMLNSGLPPVVREGDRLNAIFTVRNAGEQPMQPRITAHLTPDRTGAALNDPAPLTLAIPAGAARDAVFEIEVPAGVGELRWDITARDESGGSAQDQLKITQTVLPAVPVRTIQATLAQVDGPWTLAVQAPTDALPGRGAVEVALRPRLADALSGVTDYMRQYPYSCLEQKVSTAIALRDKSGWSDVLAQLPVSMDRDGLLRYFPSDSLMGSDTLTSYVLAIAHEAGWSLPDKSRERMVEGLKKFVGGRVVRDSAIAAPDLSLRKLAAIEALSRYGEATPALLDSITLDPNAWPTSGLIDWLGILRRVEGIPARDQRRQAAEQILRSRLTYHGTLLGFSTEFQDALGWLMRSPDQNAVRLLLTGLEDPAWQDDLPKLARGALGRQRQGRWNMTTANAWGMLAMEKFSARFESEPVTGSTTVTLGDQHGEVVWSPNETPSPIALRPPVDTETLSVRQQGSGKPWVAVQVKAALPLTQPLESGFKLKRTISPVEQKTPGVWTRGDTARVTLELEAQSDMSWVVVDDPIPAGSTILGKGLGGESNLLTQGERRDGRAWLAYEERRQDAYRAYYQFVPKGSWTVEYTLRLNNPGRFVLPATHVEALYAPEVFADAPNAPVEVSAP